MSWLVVLLIAVTIWAVLENYWRRKHTERESFWRGCAVEAMTNAAAMRKVLDEGHAGPIVRRTSSRRSRA